MSTVLDRPLDDASPHILVGIEPVNKPRCSPSLVLATAYWSRMDPPWWLIEATLRSCHGEIVDQEIGEFCILSQQGSDTYVQTAYCPEVGDSWRLEWRSTDSCGSYTHYFATVQSDGDDTGTVHQIDVVIAAFKAFYQGRGLPEDLVWETYDV